MNSTGHFPPKSPKWLLFGPSTNDTQSKQKWRLCYDLVAHTDLSIQTIHKILFDGIEIEPDPRHESVILVEGHRCSVSLLPDPNLPENAVLDLPENLIVSFYIGWSYEGFVSALKVVMNWLRNTTGDCAFVRDVHEILLLRVNGQTVSNNSEDAWAHYGVMDLIDVAYEEDDLRFERWEDYLYLRATHDAPQVAASFCQHIYEDYEIEISEASSGTSANVEMDGLSINVAPWEFDPQLPLRYQGGVDDRYGFLPNTSMYVLYKKKFWRKDGERDTPLRDVILHGTMGLIRRMDYSLVLKLDSPSRIVLAYHDSELSLFEDIFWSDDRLLLFKDIPYRFKNR